MITVFTNILFSTLGACYKVDKIYLEIDSALFLLKEMPTDSKLDRKYRINIKTS